MWICMVSMCDWVCTPSWRIRLKALSIIRRNLPVLLGKMGLISDILARLQKRQTSKSSEALKSKDCVSFCLSTDSYRVAIKRSLNCQTSVQLLPSSSYLDLLFGNASSGFNYIAYALPYRDATRRYRFYVIFFHFLLYLLLRMRPIITLGKLLLYNLLESFDWVKTGAI